MSLVCRPQSRLHCLPARPPRNHRFYRVVCRSLEFTMLRRGTKAIKKPIGLSRLNWHVYWSMTLTASFFIMGLKFAATAFPICNHSLRTETNILSRDLIAIVEFKPFFEAKRPLLAVRRSLITFSDPRYELWSGCPGTDRAHRTNSVCNE